jgi:hypothetical protein
MYDCTKCNSRLCIMPMLTRSTNVIPLQQKKAHTHETHEQQAFSISVDILARSLLNVHKMNVSEFPLISPREHSLTHSKGAENIEF